MYAIVYKSDGFPICRQVPGVSPDPVVTWNTVDQAKAFHAAPEYAKAKDIRHRTSNSSVIVVEGVA